MRLRSSRFWRVSEGNLTVARRGVLLIVSLVVKRSAAAGAAGATEIIRPPCLDTTVIFDCPRQRAYGLAIESSDTDRRRLLLLGDTGYLRGWISSSRLPRGCSTRSASSSARAALVLPSGHSGRRHRSPLVPAFVAVSVRIITGHAAPPEHQTPGHQFFVELRAPRRHSEADPRHASRAALRALPPTAEIRAPNVP
jgi:hypothetical protein